jgi:hypothetical protein
VIGIVFGALLLWQGHLVAAVALLALLGVLTQARAVSPRFARGMDRAMSRFAGRVAQVVATVLLGAVYVVILVPGWLLMRLTGQRLGGPAGWAARPPSTKLEKPQRSFGVDRRPALARSGRSRALAALGVVFALLVLDLAAGAVLSGTHALEPVDRGDLRRLFLASQERPTRPRAWADVPFAEAMDAEFTDYQLSSGDFQFEPFLGTRVQAYDGRYLNTTDRERISYEPPLSAGDRPLRIAFFGGSVMFGMGQRDEHTIPSEFARLAEERRVSVQVRNFGLPRWVAWQEVLYLERLLADGESFDAIVMLDGYNEFAVQAPSGMDDPTFYSASGITGMVGQVHDQRATEPGFFDGLDELVETYRRNSATWRLVDRARGVEAPSFGSGADPGSPEEQVANALGVFGRAVDLGRGLAEDHGIPIHHFWQPREGGWPDPVLAALPSGVVDVSGVFDGREGELYYDGIHTNERGARLLAEALWREIGPDLAAAAT